MWVRFILLIAVLLNKEDEVSGRYDFEEIEKLNKNDLEGINMFNEKTLYIIMLNSTKLALLRNLRLKF